MAMQKVENRLSDQGRVDPDSTVKKKTDPTVKKKKTDPALEKHSDPYPQPWAEIKKISFLSTKFWLRDGFSCIHLSNI